MATAKEDAATHLEAEEGETATVEDLKDDAQEAWEDEEGDLEDLEGLYNDDKETWDGTLATTVEKKAEWDAAALKSGKIATAYTASTNALLEDYADDDGNDSVAKLKKAQDLILDNTADDDDDSSKLFILNGTRDTWVDLAKDTVQKMKAWVVDEDVDADNEDAWTNVGANDYCAGSDY